MQGETDLPAGRETHQVRLRPEVYPGWRAAAGYALHGLPLSVRGVQKDLPAKTLQEARQTPPRVEELGDVPACRPSDQPPEPGTHVRGLFWPAGRPHGTSRHEVPHGQTLPNGLEPKPRSDRRTPPDPPLPYPPPPA